MFKNAMQIFNNSGKSLIKAPTERIYDAEWLLCRSKMMIRLAVQESFETAACYEVLSSVTKVLQ